MNTTVGIYGTGKRKCAIARVWLRSGNGQVLINRKEVGIHFPSESHQFVINTPMRMMANDGTFGPWMYDVFATIQGGGKSAQADAVRHGIAMALCQVSPMHYAFIRKHDLRTRDARIKERNKCGLRGARKSSQFSKR